MNLEKIKALTRKDKGNKWVRQGVNGGGRVGEGGIRKGRSWTGGYSTEVGGMNFGELGIAERSEVMKQD